jgi:hypothetical protein
VPYESTDYHGLVEDFFHNKRVAARKSMKVKQTDLPNSDTSSLFNKTVSVKQKEVAGDRAMPICPRIGSYLSRRLRTVLV